MTTKAFSSRKKLFLAVILVILSWFVLRPFLAAGNADSDPVTFLPNLPQSEPFPTTPPDASKISVGTPDVDGDATVTGLPGAVPAGADVVVINVSAHTVITDTADSVGAFAGDLYAPPGSSLLVKYETGSGDLVERFWQTAVAGVAADTVENINPLPGTMIYVSAPPPGNGEMQDFSIVGTWFSETPKGWMGWQLEGSLQVPPGNPPPGLGVQAGQTITLTAQFHGTSPGINCSGSAPYNLNANVRLRYIFDQEGRSEPWGIWFNSHLFTPTGLPMEHEAGGEIIQIKDQTITPLTCESPHTFVGDLQTTIAIPPNLPGGVFRPEIEFTGNVPLGDTVPLAVVWYHFGEIGPLPLLRVGNPAPPRIPWTLLGDYPINGVRGVQAREDQGAFEMPTRVLYPPHQVVIPRLDERTGEPLVYRLEPGSHWLSATERRQPPPAHIPLAFPSGEIVIEVFKPDGSVDLLGPAPIRQSSLRTPTTPGGAPLDEATGHIGDLYHLATMEDAFGYSFDQYGPHTIMVYGEVQDIYGNVYNLNSTYDLTVARVLDLDPGQLPTTPYMQGDAFSPGLHLYPPVPADVTVRLVHMPFSDPTQAVTTTITGQANRFGYFQPPAGTEVRLETPGEFRVDISATYGAPDGTLWAGYATWGNVVEGVNALIEAHGRRGMDYKSDTIDDMPPWFIHQQLPPEKTGVDTYYPYISGDVHWGNETPDSSDPGDSIHSVLTLKDLTGPAEIIYDLLRDHYPRARNIFRWPPLDTSLAGLEKRLDIGEAPLYITTQSGIDPAVEPGDIDMWGYWYGSSERPDVHVREIISEDGMGTAYWRFNDTYGYQIGEPADGDQPGDIKWEFGGVVLRVPDQGVNEYAIYSSLWVLLPHNDPVGARITPPFQDATGASINGGPILTLLGQDVDMLFLPKGVRPGDILEIGNTVAFCGHVGPPLDSRVEVTITSPTGIVRANTWHANKIGWLYDPSFDFVADEPGRWTVDVFVEHDRPYVGNGVIPQSHNTGTVLGTSGGYSFYVVEPNMPELGIISPQPGFIIWPQNMIEPVTIQGVAPPGTTGVHYTIHDKGVVMGHGMLTPGPGGVFTFDYDAVALHNDFSMLSLTAHEGRWQGLADEVMITFLAEGAEPRAAAVNLIGEEVFLRAMPADIWNIYLPLVTRVWQ